MGIISGHVTPDDAKWLATVDACDDHATVATPTSATTRATTMRDTTMRDTTTRDSTAGRVVIDSTTGKELPVQSADSHEDCG